MESVFLNIELYRDGIKYCAYISEDGSSGYTVKASSIEQCGDKIKQYVKDVFKRDTNNEYEGWSDILND